MVAFLFGAVLMHAVFGYDSYKQSSNWKAELVEQNQKDLKTIQDPKVPEQEKAEKSERLMINQYRVEKNIAPTGAQFFALDYKIGGESLTVIFILIIAAMSVSSEFSMGTIKLLMIRPVNRVKILLAKYLSVIVTAIFFVLLSIVLYLVIGGIAFGLEGFTTPYLTILKGKVVEANFMAHLFKTIGLSCVQMIMLVTFAFMISTVFRNSSLAIGLSLLCYFMGSLISYQIYAAGQEWMKYSLFLHTDLSVYLDDRASMIEGMTLGTSITVLVIHFLVFIIASFVTFKKRDIAI
jgi:ABC-2 type transport system permease protein